MPLENPIPADHRPIQATAAMNSASVAGKRQIRSFLWATAVLIICFGLPLFRMLRFAVGNDLYSYIPLIPVVSLYLIRTKKSASLPDSKPLKALGALLFAVGLVVMGVFLMKVHAGEEFEIEDSSCLTTLAFYLCFLGVACFFLGRTTLKALAFPLGIMIFIVPMPVFLRAAVQSFLQYGSASAAEWMFQFSGMAFLRNDLEFWLPTIRLEVAPECSGIHSSWILLITSLLAGYLFLRSPWKRTALAVAVVPLALLRNGFRVFTIGELCVHIGPKMIDSWIHRHGGPFFFVLSLVPFFLLLVWLRRTERNVKRASPQN
jgi:exosortase C (VPDSG-CTERM-specific)